MNCTTIDHNYYKWTINSGDYYRSYESTESYAKKLAVKKAVSRISKIFLYMSLSFAILILFL
ncbi:MAG: hypothetical protein P4L35_05335 [Ignavibacteriaceae bacterium]|nr:hypothetical protein [Ignavibacteriaceae bacterium]